jgi:twitching motility protein PilT
MRLHGRLVPMTDEKLKPQQTHAMAKEMLPENFKDRFTSIGSLDFSYSIPGVARFRVNVFHQRGTVSIVMRAVNFEVPSFEELFLPPVLADIAANDRGLVLVTGVTGSGKSTTLASMIEYINQRRNLHIVTIEDPIEYLYTDKSCIINQQELGLDTPSFDDALRRVLRQDPDVILIGEMRDKDTILSAVKAAETGHLVFSTLHTADAVQTVDRILKYFPPDEQDLIRMQLSLNLRAVISQRLLRRAEGSGRVPGVEVMVGTPIINKLILQGKTSELRQAIRNREAGMQSFLQSLVDLVVNEVVTIDEAKRNTENPLALERNIKGGYSDGDKGGLIGF